MRIIGGTLRGRKIKMPKDIRPTRDFVREAIFNILMGRVQDKVVYDVCAGSGAFGLEALSRGAKRAIFVEKNKEHCSIIKENISCVLKEYYEIKSLSFEKIKFFEEGAIIFFDPPYNEKESYEKMFELGKSSDLLIMESDKILSHDQYILWDQRHYGSTYVSFFKYQNKK